MCVVRVGPRFLIAGAAAYRWRCLPIERRGLAESTPERSS
jgi:hypothetical protein